MRVAVVGAGIFGLAAALTLRARGHQVTLFEQQTLPSPVAGSTDVSKSIQRLYDRRSHYVDLVEQAARQWQDWQRRLGRDFYFPRGQIEVVRRFEPGEQRYESWLALRERGAPVEALTAVEARRRFPQLIFHPGETCLYDPWGGHLLSGRACVALAELARAEGVVMRARTPVERIEEGADGVTLGLATGALSVDRAVVAAGVWLGRLVPALTPLIEITRQQMAFFRPADPSPFAVGRLPVWGVDPGGENWYGHPLLPEGIVKIAYNRPGETLPPDGDRQATADFLALARAWVGERLPGLAAAPLVGGRSCYYDNTPDRAFIIDWAPGGQRLLVAGGGSGHGFKFGGAIGPLIADALEEREHPLGHHFRLGQRRSRLAPPGSPSPN